MNAVSDNDLEALGREFGNYLSRPWTFADPPDLFRRLREIDPVHQGPDGMWYITGFKAAEAAYRHPGLSRAVSAKQMFSELGVPGRDPPEAVRAAEMQLLWLLHTDDPQHARLRNLVAPTFSAPEIAKLRGMVEEIVDGIVDGLKSRDSFDFLHEFAYPLPEQMICGILGVPQEDMRRIITWIDQSALFNTITGENPEETRRKAQQGFTEQADYFRALIRERRAKPQDRLMDSLIQAERAGDRLSEDELVAMLMQLTGAGYHTTAHLISNAMLALLSNPDQLALLRADPNLTAKVTEETLRYDPASSGQPRVATEDVEIEGKTIRAGEQVAIVLRAANRDPERFEDPDRFLIQRENNRHLGFGIGAHLCLGNWLARLETNVALERAVQRLGDLELVTTDLERAHTQLRSLKSLPLRRLSVHAAA